MATIEIRDEHAPAITTRVTVEKIENGDVMLSLLETGGNRPAGHSVILTRDQALALGISA